MLRGLALGVSAGQMLQVVGKNGAGKTSLLRALCGMLYLEEGRVLWDGHDVRHDLPAFHGSLTYLGHEPPLKADLTVDENLRYWVGLRRRVTLPQLASALETAGIAGLAERLVRTLSAGQKRRVALAALTLFAAPLWLLDEPTTHLDASGHQLVAQLIEQHVRAGGLAIAALHHDIPINAQLVRRLELSAT